MISPESAADNHTRRDRSARIHHLTIAPIATGLVATSLAALLVCAWLAIGSVPLRSIRDDDELAVPAAILIGSAVTSFLLALFARGGMVRSGVALTGLFAILTIVWRRTHVSRAVRNFLRQVGAVAESRWERVVLAVLGLILWLSAIAPPRSADAMRYHLAHIRQIVTDGAWVPIADFHYALPFGWSLSYLPFELLGLPQGAQLLGVFLYATVLAGFLAFLRKSGVPRAPSLLAVVLLLHPFVIKTFTEANADAYSMLAVFVISVLIVRVPRASSGEIALLGFATWAGLQSRYQLAAVALAATLVTVWRMRERPDAGRQLRMFGGGAVAGLAVASPFYIANAADFGNPVWPLLIGHFRAAPSYADAVASEYGASLGGHYEADAFAAGALRLITAPEVFPLAILTIAVIVAAAISRKNPPKDLGIVGLCYLLLWVAIQPLLYPRFILIVLPVAVICAGMLLTPSPEYRSRLLALARAGGLVCVLAAGAFSWREVRFSITGNVRDYHRFTWFYPVYDWVNRNTERDARVLVVVSSGHSYYLDRPHRRADPWLSGVVDWSRTSTGAALASALDSGRYRFVIYEDRNWEDFRGGTQMHGAVSQAIAEGALTPIREFDARLYTSRVRERYRRTRVYVLERKRGLPAKRPGSEVR